MGFFLIFDSSLHILDFIRMSVIVNDNIFSNSVTYILTLIKWYILMPRILKYQCSQIDQAYVFCCIIDPYVYDLSPLKDYKFCVGKINTKISWFNFVSLKAFDFLLCTQGTECNKYCLRVSEGSLFYSISPGLHKKLKPEFYLE